MYLYFSILFFFVLIDIALYRVSKKNFFIDNFKISFFVFLFFITTYYFNFRINISEIVLLIINYFLFILFYHLLFLGIKKTSPTLFIINEIKNKNANYSKIKSNFMKQKFFQIRYQDNISQKLIKKKNNELIILKKGSYVLRLFSSLEKILKIHV